jgi:hypothetical protein
MNSAAPKYPPLPFGLDTPLIDVNGRLRGDSVIAPLWVAIAKWHGASPGAASANAAADLEALLADAFRAYADEVRKGGVNE